MSAPRYARFGSRVLARYAPPVSDDPPSDQARAEAIALIERTITKQARARQVARWAAAIAAAALVATFATWEWSGHGGAARFASSAAHPHDAAVVAYPLGAGARVWIHGGSVALSAGGALGEGSRIQTPPSGRAALAFATGTSGVLGENADLTVSGDDALQVLRLDAGSVDLHVAKVSPTHRFLVSTPDAEIEVHGTQFRVSIEPSGACDQGSQTRLTVTEGIVVIRHGGIERQVAAGQQWPGPCVTETEAPSAAPNAAPSASMPSTASMLAEQNDLFAEGVDAKHRGDRQGAVVLFDRFLAAYPGSPLAQSAVVERMRLLQATSATRAVVSARQYLARYPNGFAAAEAEAIVAGEPSAR